MKCQNEEICTNYWEQTPKNIVKIYNINGRSIIVCTPPHPPPFWWVGGLVGGCGMGRGGGLNLQPNFQKGGGACNFHKKN